MKLTCIAEDFICFDPLCLILFIEKKVAYLVLVTHQIFPPTVINFKCKI